MSIKKIALTLFFAIICIGAWKANGEFFTSIAVPFFRIFICVNCIFFWWIFIFKYDRNKKNKVDKQLEEMKMADDVWW